MALYRISEFPQNRLKQPDYSIRYFSNRPLQQIEIYSAESYRVGTISDLLVDELGNLRYLTIDTGSHKRLLLPIERWQSVSEQNHMYVTSLNREEFETLAEYDDTRIDKGESIGQVYRTTTVEESVPVEATSPVSMRGAPLNSRSAPQFAEQPTESPVETESPGPVETESPGVQLFEERLVTQTQRVKTGEVKISKRIITENVEASIPVTKEKIIIEIESIYGGQTRVDVGDAQVSEDGSVRVGIYEEQAMVCRQIVPHQNVAIRKEVVTDRVTAQEQLRRETLDVQTEGSPMVVSIDETSDLDQST